MHFLWLNLKAHNVLNMVISASVTGMSVKLWHNCGEQQFGVVFPQKLGCGCGVLFPKLVVDVEVVVAKI